MAEERDDRIKLGGTWNQKTKKDKKPYISSGWIKLSQEEFDTLIEWQSDGYAVKFQIWPNDFKKESKHPDHNLFMVRGEKAEDA